MLAQNFIDHEVLKISQRQHAALISVLGMLEREEVSYVEYEDWDVSADDAPRTPVGFNMQNFYADTKCGTVCCIAGWAESIGKLPKWNLAHCRNSALEELFAPMWGVDMNCITVSQAATALRNYLTTGEAQWESVLFGANPC